MDVGDDTTTSNGRFNERVQLLITTNGELEMAGCNTLKLQVFRSVSRELKDLGSQILEDGSAVNGSSGTNTAV